MKQNTFHEEKDSKFFYLYYVRYEKNDNSIQLINMILYMVLFIIKKAMKHEKRNYYNYLLLFPRFYN